MGNMENKEKASGGQREHYLAKENLLKERLMQVAPMDFYRDLFPQGAFELEKMKGNTGLCNGIVRFRPEAAEYEELKKNIDVKVYIEILKGKNAKDFEIEFEKYKDSAREFGKFIVDEEELRSRLDKLDAKDFGAFKDFVRWLKIIPFDTSDNVYEFDLRVRSRLDKLDEEFGAGKFHKPYEKVIGKTFWDRLVHDDLTELEQAMGKSYAYIAPIGYFGGKANSRNASWLYAITIDLDGVDLEQLEDVFHQMSNGSIPEATYIVNSGHGLHLYYFLAEPLALYNNRLTAITRFKNALTWIIWNGYTSKFKKRDSQGATQQYRVVGSMTKLGSGYPCTAYLKSGKRVSLDYLNNFIEKSPDRKIAKLVFPQSLGKEYWKEHNPNWYKRVILGEKVEIQRTPRFPWLSEKMKELVLDYCRDGNRYNGLKLFFENAAALGVSFQECYDWAVSQLDELNSRTVKVNNEFTIDDIDAAAAAYKTFNAKTPKLETIEGVFNCHIERNRRNGRAQQEHMNFLNKGMDLGFFNNTHFTSDTARKAGSRGRGKSKDFGKEQMIRDYIRANPDATKAQVIKATGISKPTVYKWYDKIKSEMSIKN